MCILSAWRSQPSCYCTWRKSAWRGQRRGVWNTFWSDKHYLFPLTNLTENLLVFKEPGPLQASVKLTFSVRAGPGHKPARLLQNSTGCLPALCCYEQLADLREETKTWRWTFLGRSGRIHRVPSKEDTISWGLLGLWCLRNPPHHKGLMTRCERLGWDEFLVISQVQTEVPLCYTEEIFLNMSVKK